jgi:hypothetical protein
MLEPADIRAGLNQPFDDALAWIRFVSFDPRNEALIERSPDYQQWRKNFAQQLEALREKN